MYTRYLGNNELYTENQQERNSIFCKFATEKIEVQALCQGEIIYSISESCIDVLFFTAGIKHKYRKVVLGASGQHKPWSEYCEIKSLLLV